MAKAPSRVIELIETFDCNIGSTTKIQRLISTTDKQIDNLVYQLYNFTPEEIAIIEKSA